MKADIKLQNIVNEFGVEAINLCIKRHTLSNEKRSLWSIQYNLYKEDEQKNKLQIEQLKNAIEKLSKEIEDFDQNLLMYGITSRNRPLIVKTVKEVYPDDWVTGFVEN